MTKIITFQDALATTRGQNRYLLLGNGFSMALRPDIFSYKRLFEEADFSAIPQVREVFLELGTFDFENVIRGLILSPKIVNVYAKHLKLQLNILMEHLKKDAEQLKSILVQTIASKHPHKVYDIEDCKYLSCRNFLNNFNKVYTLNYDLLLYWAMLHDDDINSFNIDDGFRLSDLEYGAGYRKFDSPHSPKFFFLHGALHIFDAGKEIRKYTWSDTRIPIMEQIRSALDQNLFPLFVAEGTSEEKITKINHSAYLSKALRSFESICNNKPGALFVYGHSLDDNDEHIIEKIKKGNIKSIYVSLFNHPETGYDEQIISKALNLGAGRKEAVQFFDAASANVWG